MQNDLMPNFLKNRSYLTPNRVAVYFNNRQLTFHELYERSVETAGKFQSQGVRRGQYVGVLLKNHLDTIVVLFALQLLGVRAVILNNRLTSSEIIWQLKDSQAAFLITEKSFADKELEIRDMIPTLPTLIKEQLDSLPMETPDIEEEINLGDVCTIMYTSGTTGKPKGVMQTYGNHWWSSVGSALNLGFTDSDCWLCSVPLFHISGYSILMRSVIYGMPIVLHESFDVEKIIEDFHSKRVTIMSVVGTMLTRIVDFIGEEQLPQSFRCMLLGGGPAPLPLLQFCVAKDIPVFQTYGMTETSSQIVTLSPEYSISKLGSAGKPLFPSQVRIMLDDGRRAQEGETGEIFVKGPNVTPGYLNRPGAMLDRTKDGWFSTGDIGYLDDEGFLYVLDRRSDLIISGGENVYPAEIESVLLSHPFVKDAGVTGQEDERWGQVPIAFIVIKERIAVSRNELELFCMERLAKYKVPKDFKFVEELPRNASNKLLRRKLKGEH
ncbi:o-succinylbenzoate--CoA ligase [Bacillus salipaludis]|uniref:2-succinylbenzoate--CoA ligase n=1 Tax=Bacillus salipaludis TaxID=2547811 RepID=A0AA90QWV8_9BACI|nr:o-succinylbenzoate--CoA ligase [Bacillus salipaludis]MDQ6600032.1 o-succinylbenzoate--CoA ligase [Bacillus salipaludis]